MAHFTIKDVNRDGDPILYLVVYDSEATKEKFDRVRKEMAAQGYTSEDISKAIQSKVRRVEKNISLGKYSKPEKWQTKLRKIAEKQAENEENARKQYEQWMNEKKEEEKEKKMNDTFQRLQTNHILREFKINQLLSERNLSEDVYKLMSDEERIAIYTEVTEKESEQAKKKYISELWNEIKFGLYGAYRQAKIDEFKKEGATHTQAQIRYNKELQAEYDEAQRIHA